MTTPWAEAKPMRLKTKTAYVDYGPSVFDVRHNLVMASVYEFPFGPGKRFLQFDGTIGKVVGGWSLSGLGVFHTGHPLTVTIGLDPTQVPFGDSRANQRPDIVPGVPIVPPNQNPSNWVNIAAFVQPPQDASGVDTFVRKAAAHQSGWCRRRA